MAGRMRHDSAEIVPRGNEERHKSELDFRRMQLKPFRWFFLSPALRFVHIATYARFRSYVFEDARFTLNPDLIKVGDWLVVVGSVIEKWRLDCRSVNHNRRLHKRFTSDINLFDWSSSKFDKSSDVRRNSTEISSSTHGRVLHKE